jgi:hypothetical protein
MAWANEHMAARVIGDGASFMRTDGAIRDKLATWEMNEHRRLPDVGSVNDFALFGAREDTFPIRPAPDDGLFPLVDATGVAVATGPRGSNPGCAAGCAAPVFALSLGGEATDCEGDVPIRAYPETRMDLEKSSCAHARCTNAR